MKKILLNTTSLLIICILSCSAQDFSTKYGKVTLDELKMTTYPNDTSAAAVVLYDDVATYYIYSQGFKVVTEVKRKIKILKPEGVEEANVNIAFFDAGVNLRDHIGKLEAVTYNLENGKITTSKVEKKYIFEEKLSKNYKQIKFAFPNVKVGSVIELKYEKSSDRYYDIPDKLMQSSIPIKYIRYETRIPEYFVYNIETRGFERMNIEETDNNQAFSVVDDGQLHQVNSISKQNVYTMTDVPAMKDAAFVWDVEDYLSAVRHELKATNFPYDFYRPYTSQWSDVEKLIKQNTDFYSNINRRVPFEDELNAAIIGKQTDKEKIETIFSIVKSKVRWNGNYDMIDNDTREAFKNGTGSNAQINAILISALNKSGIKAYPILMSQRSKGRLTYVHPSIDRLSTYIVGVDGSDGSKYYLDGSSDYGGVNVMPVDLLVDRAYILDDTQSNKWVDLTNLEKSQEVHVVLGSLDNDGKMKGTATQFFMGQDAYEFKKTFRESEDSITFVENYEKSLDIEIEKIELTGINMFGAKSESKLDFTKHYEIVGDYIYINPILFIHIEKNPFTESERKLPIEFTYPLTYIYTATITLPENYTVSELPQSVRITLLNDKGRCTYRVASDNKNILINYHFELNQTLFPPSEYQAIRDFWGQTALKNTEMIVLKKI